MANKHGDFIWYELMTRDPESATAFYEDVVGWKIVADAPGGEDYRMIEADDGHRVGGMLRLSDEMCARGAKPAWLGYVAVDDVDRSLAKLEKLGGSVLMPAKDIPQVGRLALVADPKGLPFYLMRGAMEDKESRAFHMSSPGHCAWNELTTPDQEGALSFYGDLFGWENRESMPMGEMGEYKFIHQNGEMIGAVSPTNTPDQWQGWTYYFLVPDIDVAEKRIHAHGASLMFGPHEVPGGDYIIIAADPQGAGFAVVGPRKK